ncbi:MAG: hypothetical protein U9N76_00300 [Candidatus Marinimicrobia bacterium]|nr:hypothetical protein [Candidatus Neomarinimicrobiota bacterium]
MIFIILFVLGFSIKLSASDTTNIKLEQINEYYKIKGITKFHISNKKYFLTAEVLNNSKIYSKSYKDIRVKNELNSSINYSRFFFNSFSSGVKINYFSLSDEHINYSNDYSKMYFGFINRFKPNALYLLNTGFLSERRMNIQDKGYFINFHYLPNSNYDLKPYSKVNYEKTHRRQNYKINNRILFNKEITKNVRNKLQGKYLVINREYFVDELGKEIEKRTNERYDFSNNLVFPIASNSRMDYDVEFISNNDRHRFSFADSMVSRTYKMLEFNNKVKMINEFRKLKTIFFISNEYKQYQSEATTDGINLPTGYIFNKKIIKLKSSYKFSKKDTISVQYNASLLNFDTPDTANYDDRDELSYSINTKWRHQFNSFLYFDISGYFYFHHLVYLWHQKSANNHWNRTYSIKSNIVLNIPNRIIWKSEQEIYTNYFVYDYEYLPFVHVNSIVFRGLKLNQNFKYYIKRNYGINIKLFSRWEDRGFLDWENFYQESTHNKFEYKVALSFFVGKNKISANIGPSFSERFDYSYDVNNEKYLSYSATRKGVSFSIRYKHFFDMRYNLQSIKQQDQKAYLNNSGLVSIHFTI